MSFVRTCREKCEIAAAVQRGIGQGDTCFSCLTENGKDPSSVLLQRWAARKQRRGVSILTNTQQGHIENWSNRIELIRAIVLQQRLIARSRFVGGKALRRDRMNSVKLQERVKTARHRPSDSYCPGCRAAQNVRLPKTSARVSMESVRR